MSRQLKISIITVTYNNYDGLLATCESLYKQQKKNFQHIIIDGQSTDGSRDLLKKYGYLGSVIVSETDQGIYDAMNKGLRAAKGDFIGFLNAGDVYCDDMVLFNLHAKLKSLKVKSRMAIYGNKYYYDKTNKLKRSWRPGKFKKYKYLLGWMTPHQATYISSDCYKQLGQYKLNYKIAADYELMFRFFYKHEVNAIYHDLDIVRMEDGGLSNANFINIARSNYEVLKSWLHNGFIPPVWIFFTKPISKLFQKI